MRLQDDIRLAIRRLRHQPGFSLVAIVTLALGLGANTAIFTLVRGAMLQALPVDRPDELYRLGDDDDCCVNSGLEGDYSLFSYPLYEHLRDSSPAFSSLAAFQATSSSMAIRSAGSPALSVSGEFVSANYFTMFGVRAEAGRLLQPEDDRPGAPAAFVMSHRAWTDTFGRAASMVGATVTVNGVPMTLVGIAAEGFFGDTLRADPPGVWIPLGQEPVLRASGSVLERPDQNWLYAIGRLAPGTTSSAAAARATSDLRQWLSTQTFLTTSDRTAIGRQQIVVVSARGGVQVLRLAFGQSLVLLFAMSGLVLLVACANLANLLLARANRGEAALRAALGASTGRLVRQALTEGLVLSIAGAAAALVVADLATHAMIALVFPTAKYVPIDTSLSWPVLAFALVLGIATGVIFAAAPAWALSRVDPIDALRGVGRVAGGGAFVPRRTLVITQVALSLVLLTGAGLLVRSLQQLEHQTLGFETDRRSVIYINSSSLASTPARLPIVYRDLLDHLARVPGIERATYSLYSPMEGNNWSSRISIDGRPSTSDAPDSASWNRIGPNYFETIGTPVLEGRAIRESDRPASEHVVVVNEAFERKFFKDATALGHHVGIGDASHALDYVIVGIVADVKYAGASRAVSPMMFMPALQTVAYADETSANVQARSLLAGTIEIRLAPGAAASEPAIRRAIAAVDSNLTVIRVRTMAEQVSVNFRLNRLMARLTTAYGIIALALASLGLYGVTAYGVARRRKEIGVRLALGALPGRVARDVMRGALIQTAVGLAIGVPVALAAGRTISSLLYGIDARSPAVIGLAAIALVVSGGLAAFLPARQAASVDPTEALRSE